MRNAVLLLVLLHLLFFTEKSHGADSFYSGLTDQLSHDGLSKFDLCSGDLESDVLSSFSLVSISGSASEDRLTFSHLPFSQGLRVQSQSAPNETWQQFIQRPIASKWIAGDVGLLVFSVHALNKGQTNLEASVKGAEAPYPVIAKVDINPEAGWKTVYLPFTVSSDVDKTNLEFFFGAARQTLEIGGIAVFHLNGASPPESIQSAISQLPTNMSSIEKGFSEADNRFAFCTPWDDSTASFLDVSYLNDGPAGSHGFIVAKGGHFVESDTGKRIRFLGTNICLGGLFPPHNDAEKVAAHLAKYGINVVRFHHQDATWAGASNCLWDSKFLDHRHLNSDQLDKMDYLAYQLEKHGIYIDMCLHVTRKFTPADGFPQSVNKIPYPYDKRVDIFDPKMIVIDKEYFHDLLTHVNPYTNLSYAADPGLLDVEINNENSLLDEYNQTPGSGLADMPPEYATELRALWNSWLVKKYGTTENLASAWMSKEQLTGGNIYPEWDDSARWTLESQGPKATMHLDGDSLRIDVQNIDATDWHVQLYQKGLGILQNGRAYTLIFEMKADKNRDQTISATIDHPTYATLGLSATAALTTEWKKFSFSFVAKNAEEGHNRFPSMKLGGQTGSTWIRNVELREGVGSYSLPPNENLAAQTVQLEPSGQLTPRADWLSFLADTEAAYVGDMRSYLKDKLAVKQMIFCSQVGFGGLWSNYREAASDYLDMHSYWDYIEQFKDPITNSPMVRALGKNDALSSMALQRNAGQPVSMTEYNVCFPNEFRSETLPGYSSFAAFQDWDAIFLFCHGDYGADGQTRSGRDKIAFPLEASVDPGIWGFLPSAALVFRSGLMPIAPAVQTLPLPASFPAGDVAQGLTAANAWQKAGVTGLDTFKRRVQLGLGEEISSAPVGLTTGTIQVETKDPEKARYIADSPAAKTVFGFIGGQTIVLSGFKLSCGHLTNNFGAVTLVSMDGKPLSVSSRILLTIVTHTQNTAQTWNTSRTVLTNVGRAPVLVDGAAAAICLDTDGPRTVSTLDNQGASKDLVKANYSDGQVKFDITPDQQTIWYAITKP